MSRLSWISDDDFDECVNNLLRRCKDAKEKAKERIRKNVPDPFHSILLIPTFGIKDEQALLDIQVLQSGASAISNAIGNFHQEILSKVFNWKNHDSGYDLENESRKIIAEIKNKHNTMNSANKEKIISDLDTALKQKHGEWEAYLVVIIPKKRQRYKKQISKRYVYEVDGSTFYEMVTSVPTALHDLYSALETIIIEKENNNIADNLKKHCRMIIEASIPK